VVEPVLQRDGGSIYINLSQDEEYKLGGSSLAQTLNTIGKDAPTIKDSAFFKEPSIRFRN
jgi:phosphoribosylformylglycinamidine synthase